MTTKNPHETPNTSEQRNRADTTQASEFLDELRDIVEQMEPRGLAPAGNRLVSTRDLAKHLAGNETWWERHRQRLVDAGLLTKTGRRFVGDLRVIQQAIANPELWEGAA